MSANTEPCNDCAAAYAALVAKLGAVEDMWRQQCEQARVAREERDAWRACAEQIAPFARFLRGELEKEGVDFEVQKQIISAFVEFDRLKKEAP